MANGKFSELGRVGQFRWGGIVTEEFLLELSGRKGIETFKEMADNDPTVGAVLFATEMLIRQCKFSVEPGGTKDIDEKAAQFVEECMNDMEDTWTDTLSEIISFLTYGWSYHEIVYKRRMGKTKNPVTNSKHDDGLIGWRKLPIRSQDSFWEWAYEENSDEFVGMIQAPPPNYQHVLIPKEKALHFKTRSRKANPEGRSILRNSYRPWYFKKRMESIEGIGVERGLAGMPVLYGPEGIDLWDQENDDMMRMLAAAEGIVTGIKRDAKEGIVLPNGWKLELLSSGSGRQIDTNQIIERYDTRIAQSVLADFIFLGQQGVGSFALSSDKTRLFSVAIGTYLDIICEVFNNQAIPRLIEVNGDHFKDITEYPKMTHSDVEDTDLAALGTFISQMVGIGALIPDEGLEKFIRQEGKLPEKIEGAEPYPTAINPPPEADPNDPANAAQKQKQEEEDKKDAEEAKAAKKSLGRLGGMFK